MYNFQDDEPEENSGNGFVKRLKRGGRRITLKFAGTCADCGAELPVGSTARWYGRGRIYGLSCHSQEPKTGVVGQKPEPTKQTEMDFDPAEINPWQPDDPKTYDCTIH